MKYFLDYFVVVIERAKKMLLNDFNYLRRVLSRGILSFMTNLIKSNHARVRQQQRHITNDALELLFSYGVKKRQRKGCAVIYLSKKGKKIAVKKNIKPTICGIVHLTNRVLVTVEHRYKRIKNY